MKINIRIARNSDAPAFLRIKEQLPLTLSDGSTSTGGFLLGTDLETYTRYIANDYCLVAEAEAEEQLIGFGIILKNSSLKTSELWSRRHEANWLVDIAGYEQKKVCYFEQLAFLKGYGREVLKLAYNIVCWSFEEGHTHLFTTTVREPVLNLAAIPYILRGGGSKIGSINEIYPLIGRIHSDIYKVDADKMYPAVENSLLYPFLKRNRLALK